MTPKRILLTGASGCVGHYIADVLIHQTQHELFLLVRNPQKLRLSVDTRPGIHLIVGDMRQIEQQNKLLKTIDVAILTAAVWGGAQDVFDVNVIKTIRLMNLLDPDVCEQVIYFSTASILDQDCKPLKKAGEIGTDYIRAKYACHQRLSKLAIAPHITTVFPTLVFGGDSTKPYSHLSSGITDVTKWIGLLRFFRLEGSFHFIHAQDIAQVIAYLVEHPPELDDSGRDRSANRRELVLGSQPITVNQAIADISAYLGKRIYFRLPMPRWLIDLLISVFRIQMSAWDRFCLNYRHFTHRHFVNPSTYGLPMRCATVADLLAASGVSGCRVPQMEIAAAPWVKAESSSAESGRSRF
ncbi:MAG: NAD(P)-dependent oxidoreductase [Cyanobacteriota bacterium]